MLKYLLEKEFRQFLRNSFLVRMIVIYPIMIVLILPLAANFEVRRVKLFVVDADRSSMSSRLIGKIASSGTFIVEGLASDYSAGIGSIDGNSAGIVLEIPAGFERDLVRGEKAGVLIAANAVDQVRAVSAAPIFRPSSPILAPRFALNSSIPKSRPPRAASRSSPSTGTTPISCIRC